MAFKFILPLLFVATVVASSDDQFTHLVVNDANLIETKQGFAINSHVLEEDYIKTVSVNGDQVLITRPDCEQVSLTGKQLAEYPSYGNLLSKAKMQLNLANQPEKLSSIYAGPVRSVVAHYFLNDDYAYISSPNGGVGCYNFDEDSIKKYDEQSMSIRRPNFPDNINRIFLAKDVLTFVYNDGRVQMRPRNCLSGTERKWIPQLQSALQQAEIQFNEYMKQHFPNQGNMQPGKVYWDNNSPK